MLDTRIVNSGGHGVAIFKSCEALGIQYITQEQMVPFSITWNRQVTSIKVSAENQVTFFISGIQVILNLALQLQTMQPSQRWLKMPDCQRFPVNFKFVR